MGQAATVKELRRDLASLAKRQEVFEEKILSGTANAEDVAYFKQMSLSYAEEAKRVRSKIMDLLDGADDDGVGAEPAVPA